MRFIYYYFQHVSFRRIFLFFKKVFFEEHPPGFPRGKGDAGARESLLPAPSNTPVKDLTYKDLLTSTFTLASHERGIKTCIGMKGSMLNVIWIPTLEKQLARKGLSHRAKNHYQHRVILIENVSWKCRQKSGAHDERQTDFACRSECIGKTQPDVSWRLCRHSCGCRYSR